MTHHQLFWLLTRWNCQDLLPWSASYQRGWAISSTTGCLMQTLQFRYKAYALPACHHCSPGAYMLESLLLRCAIGHNKLMHIVLTRQAHRGSCPHSSKQDLLSNLSAVDVAQSGVDRNRRLEKGDKVFVPAGSDRGTLLSAAALHMFCSLQQCHVMRCAMCSASMLSGDCLQVWCLCTSGCASLLATPCLYPWRSPPTCHAASSLTGMLRLSANIVQPAAAMGWRVWQ